AVPKHDQLERGERSAWPEKNEPDVGVGMWGSTIFTVVELRMQAGSKNCGEIMGCNGHVLGSLKCGGQSPRRYNVEGPQMLYQDRLLHGRRFVPLSHQRFVGTLPISTLANVRNQVTTRQKKDKQYCSDAAAAAAAAYPNRTSNPLTGRE
ncbi:unnamed protein product, partial [Ectocarpus fasciculatus]